MNIYKIYLAKIQNVLIKNKSLINISSKKDLNYIIVESPPEKFNFDFSSNVAMVLAKIVNENPRNLAEKIKKILIKNIKA